MSSNEDTPKDEDVGSEDVGSEDVASEDIASEDTPIGADDDDELALDEDPNDVESERFLEAMERILNPLGMESHRFKVGWYNAQVDDQFKLDFPPEALAFVVISRPSMFERAFMPFAADHDRTTYEHDPIDECMKDVFNKIKKRFKDFDLELIHDFEMTPNRRPKVLVQTAGHVSGAVRFYQAKDVEDAGKLRALTISRSIDPVAIHPRWSGWFGLRGVVIFKELKDSELKQTEPPELLKDDEKKIELLRLFNDHWKDWRYRDVHPPEQRYTNFQKEYFETPPGERGELITKIIEFMTEIWAKSEEDAKKREEKENGEKNGEAHHSNGSTNGSHKNGSSPPKKSPEKTAGSSSSKKSPAKKKSSPSKKKHKNF